MRILPGFISVCLTVVCMGCNHEDMSVPGGDMGGLDTDPQDSSGLVHVVYTESDKVFRNPERGFYSSIDFYSESAAPITAARIGVAKARKISLFYTGYYLTDFMESDISQHYLEMIRTNMQALRDGGMKCVLRFAYKKDSSEAGHPWDASPEWVARHIEQLKPLMQEYGDVILCLQAGFIGVWGEWAYTDNFVSGPSTPEEHALRKEVMIALLDAMPKDRQIALRTPMFKRMMFLDSYADTLTLETAFGESDVARICGHNDCFGASHNDYGTFTGAQTRNFWKQETKYVMMGGETCNLSNFCKCEQSLKDLQDYHWTYLNAGYNSNVLNRWRTDGCFDEVERRLGYRLVLTDVYHTKDPVAGEDFNMVIKLRNVGFAAPVNPRAVEIVLLDSEDDKTVYELSDIDPRYWFAGCDITIDQTVKLPSDASGQIRVYLNLPDPKPALHDNPLFSIRLANDKIWNEDYGYNRLGTIAL